jgi:hypothetical protein
MGSHCTSPRVNKCEVVSEKKNSFDSPTSNGAAPTRLIRLLSLAGELNRGSERMHNLSNAEENHTLAAENMIIATRWHEKITAKYIAASLRMASRRLFTFVPRFASLKIHV